MTPETRRVLHSSASDNWATPREFFKAVDAQFGPLELDVCANAANAKCTSWFGPDSYEGTDGLAQDWTDPSHVPHGVPGGDYPPACWMNPPYGRTIGHWVKKAAETAKAGGYVVALLPARTDTQWWHAYVWDAAKDTWREGVRGRLLMGRLKFGSGKNAAPFPSALVVFGRNPHGTR